MDIPTPSKWTDGFKETKTGDATITYSGDVATLYSGSTTGSAYLQKRVQSTPGEVLTFSIMARRVSGTDTTSARLKVEWPSDGAGEGSVCYISSPEWREYEVSIGAGYTNGGEDHYDISVGVFSGNAGTIEVAYPRIKVAGSRKGAARVHAYGLLGVASGVVTLHPDFVSSGITAVSYNSTTKILSLTTPRAQTTVSDAGSAPLLFCQITTDPAAAAYTAKIGEFVRGTGVCYIKFYDGSGTLSDISALSQFYVSVMLVV